MGCVSFDSTKNLIIVDIDVEGADGRKLLTLPVVLDTGASSTIIPREVASSLGYDLARVTQQVKIVTGSGVEYVKVIMARKLTAIGEPIEDIEILCHDLPEESKVDGLLGLNFLRHFDIDISFSRGTVTIQPKKTA